MLWYRLWSLYMRVRMAWAIFDTRLRIAFSRSARMEYIINSDRICAITTVLDLWDRDPQFSRIPQLWDCLDEIVALLRTRPQHEHETLLRMGAQCWIRIVRHHADAQHLRRSTMYYAQSYFKGAYRPDYIIGIYHIHRTATCLYQNEHSILSRYASYILFDVFLAYVQQEEHFRSPIPDNDRDRIEHVMYTCLRDITHEVDIGASLLSGWPCYQLSADPDQLHVPRGLQVLFLESSEWSWRNAFLAKYVTALICWNCTEKSTFDLFYRIEQYELLPRIWHHVIRLIHELRIPPAMVIDALVKGFRENSRALSLFWNVYTYAKRGLNHVNPSLTEYRICHAFHAAIRDYIASVGEYVQDSWSYNSYSFVAPVCMEFYRHLDPEDPVRQKLYCLAGEFFASNLWDILHTPQYNLRSRYAHPTYTCIEMFIYILQAESDVYNTFQIRISKEYTHPYDGPTSSIFFNVFWKTILAPNVDIDATPDMSILSKNARFNDVLCRPDTVMRYFLSNNTWRTPDHIVSSFDHYLSHGLFRTDFQNGRSIALLFNHAHILTLYELLGSSVFVCLGTSLVVDLLLDTALHLAVYLQLRENVYLRVSVQKHLYRMIRYFRELIVFYDRTILDTSILTPISDFTTQVSGAYALLEQLFGGYLNDIELMRLSGTCYTDQLQMLRHLLELRESEKSAMHGSDAYDTSALLT